MPANVSPIPGQDDIQGQPLQFDVKMDSTMTSSLPLCLLFNARSIYNKSDNLRDLLHQICPDICLISETFEREKKRLDTVLKNSLYKSISYYRKNRATGGGCAILFNESKFSVLDLNIPAPQEVENVWALFTPKQAGLSFGPYMNVKRIAVASYYISPRSRHKKDTIDHIIDTIHCLRARYDNDIHFLIGGDFNKTPITDVLDCYGALHQIISVPTRNSTTLEIILTDLHTLFHPPTTLPPIQVDTDKKGKDSDHNTVVFAPKDNLQYRSEVKKKIIKTRPLPESTFFKFEEKLIKYPWEQVFIGKGVDTQVEIFHNFLRSNLEKCFPEKNTNNFKSGQEMDVSSTKTIT